MHTFHEWLEKNGELNEIFGFGRKKEEKPTATWSPEQKVQSVRIVLAKELGVPEDQVPPQLLQQRVVQTHGQDVWDAAAIAQSEFGQRLGQAQTAQDLAKPGQRLPSRGDDPFRGQR
jgi:hypothetical protein